MAAFQRHCSGFGEHYMINKLALLFSLVEDQEMLSEAFQEKESNPFKLDM